MAIKYPFHLPHPPSMYDSVHFLSITPKTVFATDGEGGQQKDKNGVPKWVVSAVVKFGEQPQDTETFTLVAQIDVATAIKQIPELAPVKLLGFSGGKWTREGTKETYWSFKITGVELVK